MQATMCSKYVPRAQLERREEAAVKQCGAPLVTDRPPAPKMRVEVEPPTTNMTLYGVSRAPANPAPGDPRTFEPRDWKSVTKSHYPAKTPDEYIGKDLQLQRAALLRTSNWSIGVPGEPPRRVTQFKDDFPIYERDRYLQRTHFGIGAAGTNKVRSSVEIAAADRAPEPYESMQLRQFQRLEVDKEQAKKEADQRRENKADMLRTHFAVGADGPEYRPVAALPLPTTHPRIKNRPPSAVPDERNPHVCRSVADARPNSALMKAAREARNLSHVPVLQPGGSLSGATTTTRQALPSFAKHREQRCGNAGVTFGSSLSFGTGATDYTTMSRSQFRGVYFS